MDDPQPLDARTQSRLTGLVFGLCVIPIFLLFAWFGQPGRGLLVYGTTLGFIVPAWLYQPLIAKPVVLALLALWLAAHLAAALLVPLPVPGFPPVLAGIACAADFLLALALLATVDRRCYPPQGA